MPRDRAVARRPFPSWALPLGVGLITVLAFLPALQAGFLSWDDDQNFVNNIHYRGLGLDQLRWMWTTFHLGHYVPLSWMSLGLDYELWGMNPRGYHFTNIVLHAANAVVLFFVARRLLQAAFDQRDDRALNVAAAFAALLFATHPLRVESVAWVTERRDVLSGFFCSATVLFYLRYAGDGPARRRNYVGALVLFVCALLSKATSLTIPAVLAVLNVYPLRRIGGERGWSLRSLAPVLADLAPFIIAAAATIPLTLIALAPPDQLQSVSKIAVSAYSLALYLWKTIVPLGLTPLYRMPSRVDPFAARYVISYVFLIAIGTALFIRRKQDPGVVAAAVVFLIVVFPMLGIVQNGPQIAADRYTYHAAPALAILAAGVGLALYRRSRATVLTMLGATVVLILAALSWNQSKIWHDSQTFWTYVIERDSASAVAETALGTLDLHADRLDEAIKHYVRALFDDSVYAEAHDNLGIALSRKGRFADAIAEYRRAIAINPRNRETYNNLGVASARVGRIDDAVSEFARAVQLDPSYADAQTNWGNALVRGGRFEDAIAHYREALRIQPSNADAHHNWGVALAQEGRLSDAIEQFRAALAIDPAHPEARAYLDQALRLQRDGSET